MKNATVTMPYEDFQNIKNKADMYDKEAKEREERRNTNANFIDTLCECIEKGAVCKEAGGKQYFLFKGLEAICARYDMDMKKEYGEIEAGTEPSEEGKE